LESKNGGRMSPTKVVYGMSTMASIFFGLWQQSIEAGVFVWFSLIVLWEVIINRNSGKDWKKNK
jgi:hypothetical protein